LAIGYYYCCNRTLSIARNYQSPARITMKQLPDEKTLLKLLELARDAEKKAQALCDLTTEIDEKWRFRFESKRKT
jgi:hypothetical protein